MGTADTQRCVEGFPRLAAPPFTATDELTDAVAANPSAISFTSLALRRGARPVPLGSECGVGIEPDPFRIKTEEYPLVQRLFMYVNPNRAPNAATRDFINFVLGTEGQAAVAAGGFADLAPGRASDNYGADRLDSVRNAQDGGRLRIRTGDARAFEEATAGANRLSITFRFQASTNNLDTRAEQDVQRLADLLKLPGFAKQQVVLIGFSSANGDYGENRILSKERAEAIRDRLVNVHGIKDVMSLGIGPAGAVACNLDANTASLNQRVEVWLRRAPAG
jgi:phosphate transport system substrate-binding protein